MWGGGVDFITWNSCFAFPILSRSRLSTTYICINVHICISLATLDLYPVFSVLLDRWMIVTQGKFYKTKGHKLCCNRIKHKIMRINAYQTICVVKIVPPECPQFLLSSNIPNRENNILILNLLHIETYKAHKFISLKQHTDYFQF